MIDAECRIIHEIVQRLTRVSRPGRTILFGSAAMGGMTADSDIDVLIVEPEIEEARSESRRLREALAGLGSALDVIVMSTERFEETKGLIGGIAYPANKYGKFIYEAT